MAKITYGLQMSLDGYVDHMRLGPPGEGMFDYFIKQTRGVTGGRIGEDTVRLTDGYKRALDACPATKDFTSRFPRYEGRRQKGAARTRSSQALLSDFGPLTNGQPRR